MKQNKKEDEKDIRRQILLIDARVAKLKRTGRIYFQDHGIKHSGIEKLITELINERSRLANQLLVKIK